MEVEEEKQEENEYEAMNEGTEFELRVEAR